MKREHLVSFCTLPEGMKNHKTESLLTCSLTAIQDFFQFPCPSQGLWTFSSLRLEYFPHSFLFDSPLSLSVRVNVIATHSHSSLYFPFLNTCLIVAPCVRAASSIVCDSRDHILCFCLSPGPGTEPGTGEVLKNTCCFYGILIVNTTLSFEREKPRHRGGGVSFLTGSS